MTEFNETYNEASRLALCGDYETACELYERLNDLETNPEQRARVANDLGVIAAARGDTSQAQQHFETALTTDPESFAVSRNLKMLAESAEPAAEKQAATAEHHSSSTAGRRTKVAIVSFLFNWPSTGGGIMHTYELAKFLSEAGYEVCLIHSRYAPWNIGRVQAECPFPIETIVFDESSWTAACIQDGFRRAVDAFVPDAVIVTDSWNFKPLLAEAIRGYPFFLRLAALECLCPLNNVRMLFDEQGVVSACPRHQLATPEECRTCVAGRQHLTGSLHQAERELSGYGTAAYDQALRRSFSAAEAVLVVNPLIEAMVSPFAGRVRVVPSGFDASRFRFDESSSDQTNVSVELPHLVRLFFAGLVQEHMKGFHVLHEACRRLRKKRVDFELVATGDPAGPVDEFTRFVGWLSQEELPHAIRNADILVFPTIAEEALGRSAVEAMGAGRPVIASSIGGLQFTVVDGLTGLLTQPGDVEDLMRKIEQLLDDPQLRARMGQAGRSRFDEHFTWKTIIERHYRPLLGDPISDSATTGPTRDKARS